jgi:hypothetical protein
MRFLRLIERSIILALFVCLLTGFGFLTGIASQEAQKPIQKHERTQHNKDAAKDGPREPWFIVFRVLLPSGLQGITKYCASYTEEEKNQWPQRYYCDLKITDVYVAVFSGLLVFVTLGLVWVGVQQYNDTRILQRAYLAVVPRGINPFRADKTRFSCDVAFLNAGNLPAQEVSWELASKLFPDRQREIFNPPGNKDGNVIIPARGEMLKSAPPITRDELDNFVNATTDQQAWLYIWGRVRYKDGFGKRRFVDFCHRYNVQAVGDGGVKAKYGRQHEHGNGTDEKAGLTESPVAFAP